MNSNVCPQAGNPGLSPNFCYERVEAMKIKAIAFLGLILAACSGQSHAGIILSRAALNGTDFVDWSTLGPKDYTPSVPNPSPFTSHGGVHGIVSLTTSNLMGRREQDGAVPPDSWDGNFNPGDPVLWTGTVGYGPNSVGMILDFGSQGITRGGAQIQSAYLQDFVARISAFDANNVLLGTYSTAGFSDVLHDNSAIFLGVEGIGIIHKIEFSLDSAPGDITGSFAINQFDFSPTAVPEPSSLALCGIGAIGLFIRTARRRRNTQLTSV